MDMVGGGPETKAVFHVTRSPASLPTFVNDVAEAFAEFVNEQSLAHSRAAGRCRYPLVAPEGGKEALLAQLDRIHGRQRPHGLHGGRLPDSVDLPERLAGPLYPHQRVTCRPTSIRRN